MKIMIIAQVPISYGFVSHTGVDFSNQSVDAYNAYLHDINKYAGMELATNSTAYKERELWLDRRHKFFVAANDAAKAPPPQRTLF